MKTVTNSPCGLQKKEFFLFTPSSQCVTSYPPAFWVRLCVYVFEKVQEWEENAVNKC